MENSHKPIYPVETVDNPYSKKEHQTTTMQIGLTKREHFAGLAMQALISNPNIKRPEKNDIFEYENFSKVAIEYADSLLRQLENK